MSVDLTTIASMAESAVTVTVEVVRHSAPLVPSSSLPRTGIEAVALLALACCLLAAGALLVHLVDPRTLADPRNGGRA